MNNASNKIPKTQKEIKEYIEARCNKGFKEDSEKYGEIIAGFIRASTHGAVTGALKKFRILND